MIVSGSHTAGAVRIGAYNFHIFDDAPTGVNSSFLTHSLKPINEWDRSSHGPAGILGMDTDPEIPAAWKLLTSVVSRLSGPFRKTAMLLTNTTKITVKNAPTRPSAYDLAFLWGGGNIQVVTELFCRLSQ